MASRGEGATQVPRVACEGATQVPRVTCEPAAAEGHQQEDREEYPLLHARATHIANINPWRRLFPQHPAATSGDVVLITGAGSGIGRQIALIYASRGCSIVLADRSVEAMEATAERCLRLGKRHGCKCLCVPTDVTQPERCEALINEAVVEFGKINILVLCAGIGAHHVFSDTDGFQMYQKLMAVNFFGYLHCLKPAYKHLVKSKGQLVAITSFSGEVGLPYRAAYCASKFAVTGLLESIRAEMRVLGRGSFDITIICPPTVNTNLRKNSLTEDKTIKEKQNAANAEAALTVEYVAEVIVNAADRRLRKVVFPLSSWIAYYVRPLLPDWVDRRIDMKAKL